jgi:hypothetical protein
VLGELLVFVAVLGGLSPLQPSAGDGYTHAQAVYGVTKAGL